MSAVAIVMAGGSGERFWPLSTADHPKQLLDLTGAGESLLAQAVHRVEPVFGEQIYVSTSPRLAPAIQAVDLVPSAHILAEPAKRNTLGALVWSMAQLRKRFETFTVGVLTADHRIHPDELFRQTVREALELAERSGGLVTLGVRPTRPETGYGYIEKGAGTRVARFREKPNSETAEEFLASGNFLWNSGMFFWTFEGFRRELARAEPALAEILDALVQGEDDAFAELPNLSIDVALLEQSHEVHVLPAEFAWDDLGAWSSLFRTVPLDEVGNARVGAATLLESHDNVIYNQSEGQQIFTLGISETVIVVTDREVVVFPVDRSQDVRRLIPPSR